MAIVAEDSSATLPARQVQIKTKRSSQALRTGVTMPTYTIQHDAPWVVPNRTSAAPSSVYSEEDGGDGDGDGERVADLPRTNPATASLHPSYHAHPRQQVTDPGPQKRHSRLPIFKQVRTMLHKPPPPLVSLVTPGQAKWDEYSGERSETGKVAHANPGTYVSPPYDGAFKSRKRSPDRRQKPTHKRDMSPVSVLRDDELKPTPPLKAGACSPPIVSPVSPVSPVTIRDDRAPTPVSANQRAQPAPAVTVTPSDKHITRKPAPSPSPLSSSQTENRPPQRSPSARSDWTEPPDDDEPTQPPGLTSHFSWTTVATSVAPSRPSVDVSTGRPSHLSVIRDQDQPNSRFSWSTVNTNVQRESMPPPSPPPPIPTKFTSAAQHPPLPAYIPTRGPPVQSILSRSRPVQRLEKTEWTPPPRKASAGGVTPTSRSGNGTPTSASSAIHPAFRTGSPAAATPASATVHTASGRKALPPPPELASSSKRNLSHLESLLAQEKDLMLQRQNVQKSIFDLEKIEKASPMDVSFAQVRDAKKQLEERRTTLDEVQLEEREVGIAISRARRKEGAEEGLWVRRVTE